MDLGLALLIFVGGFAVGIATTEVLALWLNRARRPKDVQPLLGVVLPPEEEK